MTNDIVNRMDMSPSCMKQLAVLLVFSLLFIFLKWKDPVCNNAVPALHYKVSLVGSERKPNFDLKAKQVQNQESKLD